MTSTACDLQANVMRYESSYTLQQGPWCACAASQNFKPHYTHNLLIRDAMFYEDTKAINGKYRRRKWRDPRITSFLAPRWFYWNPASEKRRGQSTLRLCPGVNNAECFYLFDFERWRKQIQIKLQCASQWPSSDSKLTPRRTALVEKLTLAQLFHTFPAFYKTPMFSTVSTTVRRRTLPWGSWIQFTRTIYLRLDPPQRLCLKSVQPFHLSTVRLTTTIITQCQVLSDVISATKYIYVQNYGL